MTPAEPIDGHKSTKPATILPAIATLSLGASPPHDIQAKLLAASQHGFRGVELYHFDLLHLAATALPRSSSVSKVDDPDFDAQSVTSQPTDTQQLAAAHLIRRYCYEYKISVIVLQPFLFYEGLVDRDQHAKMIQKLRLWFRLARILGTDLIQIPSNFLDAMKTSGDMDLIVKDLQEVADLGLKETAVIRFAYEAIAWAPHVNTWEKSWEIVRKVDRENFGLGLDSFNILARLYGDPKSANGKVPNADANIKSSLEKMVEEMDVEKIFSIEVADAERMREPLVEGHPWDVDGQPAHMSWSRKARLFPYEEGRGGYLPVGMFLKAMVEDLGYTGWVSMEVFSRTMHVEGNNVPEDHAKRGQAAWLKMLEGLSME
ncbi:MAG: hypothetical protein M1812_006354 [Candelaria pacifica]|nr:MAG: hypothetical protein M1812_006354 [Candelaria pacifica]